MPQFARLVVKPNLQKEIITIEPNLNSPHTSNTYQHNYNDNKRIKASVASDFALEFQSFDSFALFHFLVRENFDLK